MQAHAGFVTIFTVILLEKDDETFGLVFGGAVSKQLVILES